MHIKVSRELADSVLRVTDPGLTAIELLKVVAVVVVVVVVVTIMVSSPANAT
jgi:hypothetical protein